MFLDVAHEALQDASIETSKDRSSNIGVFVGEAHNSYKHATKPCHGSSFERRYRSLLDPNISTFTAFHLNLNGPNVTINTACASSLVALDQGVNSIRAKECDAALVGGVSIVFPQVGGYYTSEGGVFSASGKCRPLDASCDGSVPSDAVAAVVIKPLEAAIEAKDYIYSVIEGQAVGTDGSTDKPGFTVPSATGQAATVLRAMRNGNVQPELIRYVEMHGSGTPIGDAMEVQGLASAFGTIRKEQSLNLLSTTSIALGSNKGNFGNTEAASGLLSLLKVSLAVSQGVVPPLETWSAPNALIDFDDVGFYPLTTHLKLDTEDRIGVTAIGLGGTNAHCILASPAAYGVSRQPRVPRETNELRRRDRKILMAPELRGTPWPGCELGAGGETSESTIREG